MKRYGSVLVLVTTLFCAPLAADTLQPKTGFGSTEEEFLPRSHSKRRRPHFRAVLLLRRWGLPVTSLASV